MQFSEWQKEIEDLATTNGYKINFEFSGIWRIEVFDKETDKFLASTGATGIESIVHFLKMPFDKSPWK